MSRTVLSIPLLRHVAMFIIAIGILAGWHSRGEAQEVAALVSGEPITALDIVQRQRLTELSTHKPQSRQEALDELIDEKLKLQIAKRYTLNITEKDVDSAFATMARRAGYTPSQFADALTHAGLSIPSLKVHIKADIGWSAIVRGKFQASLEVGQKDIMAALQSRKKDDKPDISYQYTLRQILFIVPRGSPPALYEARTKEAEALRARFQNCEEGIGLARALKDVAIRDPVIRTSVDVPAKQREILDGTPIGGLTPPETTFLGVETFAVCTKTQSQGDTPGEREVRDELSTQRYDTLAKTYLLELRRSSLIEIR